MTNYERIKAISVEEMTRLFYDIQTDALLFDGTINGLKYSTEWEKWLNSEVEEKAVSELIYEQQSEIERLKSMNQAKLDCIHDLQKENEILSRNADTAFQDGLNERRDLFAPEIKSEAYKEFAEKAAIALANAYTPEYAHWIDVTLNNLLKELVGENK